MKKAMFALILLALLFALATVRLVPEVGAKGKPSPDVPVTVVIDGLGVDQLPTLRVQSDQLGAYVNSTSGESIIQAIGDWELDMINFNSTPQRKILLDLRDAIAGSGPNGGDPINPFGAAGYQIVRARFISKCIQNGISFLNMQTGTPYLCPLALAFQDSGGVQYRLNLNPVNYSSTNWLQVTCINTDSTGKCRQWKVEPSIIQPDGERKSVAKLIKPTTRPRDPELDYGDFYLSFTIHITK
jgi:hypothetical protein